MAVPGEDYIYVGGTLQDRTRPGFQARSIALRTGALPSLLTSYDPGHARPARCALVYPLQGEQVLREHPQYGPAQKSAERCVLLRILPSRFSRSVAVCQERTE